MGNRGLTGQSFDFELLLGLFENLVGVVASRTRNDLGLVAIDFDLAPGLGLTELLFTDRLGLTRRGCQPDLSRTVVLQWFDLLLRIRIPDFS